MKWGEYISLEKGHYNFCMLIAFFLPLHKKAVTFLIGFYVLYSLFFWFRKGLKRSRQLNLPLFFAFVLYMMLLIGALNSGEKLSAWKEIEFKASMLVFPLLALLHPGLNKQELYKIFNAFVTGSILFGLVAVFYGIYRASIHDSFEYLTYSKLGIDFHPTYMALYQGLALLWIMMRGVRQDYFFSSKWIHWIGASFVVIFISMLASKAGIISAGICIFLAAFAAHRRYVIPRHYLTVSISAMTLLVLSTFVLPFTAARFEKSAEDIHPQLVQQNIESTQAYTSTSLRKVTWSASIQLMLQNPFGLGAGNVGEALEEKYRNQGEFYAAEHHLNAHNQFLQIGMELGWIGFVLLLMIFLISFVDSLRTKTFLYPAFIFIFGLNCLLESMLEVQAGVVFFFFFLMIFVKTDFNSTEKVWI